MIELAMFVFGALAGVVAARLWWDSEIHFGKHIVRRNKLQAKLFGGDER